MFWVPRHRAPDYPARAASVLQKHTPCSHVKSLSSSSSHLQNWEEHLPLFYTCDCLSALIHKIFAGVGRERISCCLTWLSLEFRISQAVLHTPYSSKRPLVFIQLEGVSGLYSSRHQQCICRSMDPKFRAVGGSPPIVCRGLGLRVQTHSQPLPHSQISQYSPHYSLATFPANCTAHLKSLSYNSSCIYSAKVLDTPKLPPCGFLHEAPPRPCPSNKLTSLISHF